MLYYGMYKSNDGKEEEESYKDVREYFKKHFGYDAFPLTETDKRYYESGRTGAYHFEYDRRLTVATAYMPWSAVGKKPARPEGRVI